MRANQVSGYLPQIRPRLDKKIAMPKKLTMPVLEKVVQKGHVEPNGVETSIITTKKKIENEISRRRELIHHCLEHLQGMEQDGDGNWKLVEPFARFTARNDGGNFIEKRALRKRLGKIRFRLVDGKDDVFFLKTRFLGRGRQLQSQLRVDKEKWGKIQDAIQLIEKNEPLFRNEVQQEELAALCEEYKRLKNDEDKTCTGCGSSNPDDAKYCHNCGKRL